MTRSLCRATLLCLALAGCASSSAGPRASASMMAPTPDPRLSLKAGWFDAEQAAWNMRLVATAKPSDAFFNPTGLTTGLFNSDIAFTSHYVVQGSFSGFQIWDVAQPASPHVVTAYVCGGGQGDPSVYGHLLFISVESGAGRVDCGLEGVKDSVSAVRFRGVRIFDITDIAHPVKVVDVQTCRGSHTNTVVTDPHDPTNIYIYVSALSTARSPTELAGCSEDAPSENPNTQRFTIDVIQVPLAHPELSKVVSKPALLADLTPYTRHGEYAADTASERGLIAVTRAAAPGSKKLSPLGPIATACHDITVYSAVGLAGGACIGYGLLIDIHDPVHPRRIAAASDSNFWGWHSATFSNDGSQILFSDEWGGGSLPRCRATDDRKWGADAIYAIAGDKLTLDGYYKLPVAQSTVKNCVAHNGSLIPIPGRTVMVQGWYQGGVSVFDWTDPRHPTEIAYFDRGAIDSTKMVEGGSWSSYWYNGYIYSSEIARGLDVMELAPSAMLTQHEIDAAKTVTFDQLNVQDQQRFVWPTTFALARAYLDQLARDDGLPADQRAQAARDLDAGERGAHAGLALTAARLDAAAGSATDPTKVRMLADVVRALAAK
jgi:hypothetical protein